MPFYENNQTNQKKNMEEQKIFQELIAEYFHKETTEARKMELIKLMQEDLKQRNGNENDTVLCLDGNEYSMDSEIVSELYAIDNALREVKNREERDEISDQIRDKLLSRNKYSPDNPYPYK